MKKTICAILALVMLAAAAAAAIPASASAFSDVDDGRWSAGSINYAVGAGYMKGVGDGRFDPEGSLTRAMAVTVLWRREGEPEPAEECGFSDVPVNEWYSTAVSWAKEAGIVKGLTGTAFGPDELITREQLCAVLYRLSSTAPVSVPERADLAGFADGEAVSDWAAEPVAWAVGAGLIKGTDGGLLAPGGHATREQFAAIVERYDNTFKLEYNAPAVRSQYTEKPYPLVDDADLYVSTDGDDGGPGTFDEPLATFAGAVARVREIKTARPDGGITVAFKAGDYGPLSVGMTEEDSGTAERPVTYCKYGDGDVVFSGGVDLDASAFSDIGEDEKALFDPRHSDRIKKIDVGGFFGDGLDADSFELFDGKGLCNTARFPNKYEDGTDALLTDSADTLDPYHMAVTQRLLINRLDKYTDEMIRGMKIYGYIVRGYAKDTGIITGYDRDTQILTVDSTNSDEYVHLRDNWTGIKMCVTNVSRELDFKGEYWLDPSTHILYVYDPEGVYHVPVRGTMILMEKTDFVTFRGLTFRNSTGRFISGYLCHGVTVDLCDFSVTSCREGVYFDDCDLEKPLDLSITNCKFSLAYGQSVKVYGRCTGRYRYVKRANVLFDNNLVSSSNLAYDFLNAVHIESCSGVRVTHNDFVHTSRGAVSFDYSYDVLIEYNNFDSVMENSEDGGAVYNWGSVDGWAIKVCHNYFGPLHRDGTGCFGYYIDDNSGGAEVYENLFYNAACPVMFHLGRDNSVHDNVFVDTLLAAGVGVSIPHRNTIDEIGYEAAIRTFPTDRTKMWWTNIFNLIETYPEYREGVERWCPGILTVTLDESRMDDPEFYLNPVNSVTDNVYINPEGAVNEYTDKYLVRYMTVSGLRGFTLEENPLFVNPTVGDYRIKDGAAFPDIQFEKTGRY